VPSFDLQGLSRLLPSGKAILLGFALLAAGVLAYVGARETSLFAVQRLEIHGAPPAVARHVRAALASLEGESLLRLQGGEIAQRISRLPDVAQVRYDRAFPHTLRLYVTPEHSVAVLRQGPLAWVVSSDGRVVRTAGRLAAPRLPRVWVPSAASVAVGTTPSDADALRAVSAVATARAARFGYRIALVRSNAQELTFMLRSGLEIRFGDASDLPVKLAVARRVVPLARGSAYLDVSVPERPVTGGNPKVGG
jgi:cell division protein FtsQ